MVWDQPVNNEVVVEILQTSKQLENDALNLEHNKTEKKKWNNWLHQLLLYMNTEAM